MNICWVGFHEVGLYSFKKLIEDGIKISAFFTLNDASYNKRSAGTRQYIEICKRENIPVHYISHINDDDAYEYMKSYHPDIIVAMGWSQIINERMLNCAKIGVVGGHSSLLPHNRGSAPVNWSIIKGEKITGITLMWLNEGVDEGKIINQIPFPIEFFDTCKSIYNKVSLFIYIQLKDLFNSLDKGVIPGVEQPSSNEEILPRRRPSDGIIDWSQGSENVYNFVRALTKPYPCAFSYIDGNKYKIVKATLLEGIETHQPAGSLIGNVKGTAPESCGILVACGSGVIIVNEMETESSELLNGYSLAEFSITGKHFSND
jgi:methionyl-tRNA formyltransferase